MARRLINLRVFDEIEGLVEYLRKLQERLEVLEADAAEFDTPVQRALELSKANGLKHDLVVLLERLVARVKG